MDFYHYSTERFNILETRMHRGVANADEIERAKFSADIVGDIGSYLDHISLFLDPIPLEILPDLFEGKNAFYQKGVRVYEYVIRLPDDANMRWALQETPEINTYSDDWDWSSLSREKRREYIRKINAEMTRRGLQGVGTTKLMKAIKPFCGRTEEFFKLARQSPWANDTVAQYAAEVPHLMVYPTDGTLKISKTIRKVMGEG